MSDKEFNELLKRYLTDSLSEKELDELIGTLRKGKSGDLIRKAADEAFRSREFTGLTDSESYDTIFNNLINSARERNSELTVKLNDEVKMPVRRISVFYRIAVAAAVLVAVVFGSLWITKQRSEPVIQTVADLAPGGNRAMLTLGDGTTIVLDSAGNGLLAEQAGTQVVKVEDGRIAYTPEGRKKTEMLYNTITTPRAGQYELILPDGSKVWLNSESSIRFPVSFTGSFRFVEITGEAYFEVAENHEMPFRVRTAGITVEVLGTSFNVRAYADEGSVNTTLVEGSVLIASPVSQTKIIPGQMATADGSGQISIENDADIDEIIAWKKGLFMFNSENIEHIMSHISRWYDVDVVFAGEVSSETFSGIVSRKSNVSEVLRIMEQAGIKFSLTEKVITVEMK
jgi:ferric-dicitrate binding protein FerR (iron transport regulator)